MRKSRGRGTLDIGALLAQAAPPNTPARALEIFPGLRRLLERLDPLATVEILAGLQTEPQFQANHIRLDWAIRLVLAIAHGTRQPSRNDIHELLNVALQKARILWLEDPIESFLVEPAVTEKGDFLLLSGAWEQAAFYTESVVSAFSRLPDGDLKQQGLRWAYAALRLSDALVHRAGLVRRQIGSGTPQARMILPREAELRAFRQRMRFRWDDLGQIGIEGDDLHPFTLPQRRVTELLTGVPGDTVLESRPLIALADEILVASPTALTTAARAVLIDLAVEHGMADPLQRHLLEVQAEAVDDSNFARLVGFPVRRAGRYLAREFGREVSPRKFVHFLQVMDDFEGWPDSAFGSAVDQPDLASLITFRIKEVRAQLEAQSDFEEGLTICFLGGWGGARRLALPNDAGAPNWEILLIPTGDASAIARCEGGTFRDLWRLQKQHSLVEQQGFRLATINGPLNLFHWWRLTDYQLVPPDSDTTPPITIDFGTDHLLAARREGMEALDHRALPYVDGSFKRVCRLDPKGYVGDLEPIYGSHDDLRAGQFVAAVISGPLVLWLHLDTERTDPRGFDKFETLKAALKWAERILPAFWLRYGAGLDPKPTAAKLSIKWPSSPPDRLLEDDEVAATVEIRAVSPLPEIVLKPEWQWALRRPDNIAEIELATGLLTTVSAQLGIKAPASDLRAIVVDAAGSRNLRWRHSFLASHAIDVLRHHSLVERMRAIPVSAGALVKCGSAFATHSRAEGMKVTGVHDTSTLLEAHANAHLVDLRQSIARYNKRSFVTVALHAMQAALGELRSWEMTARSVRTIHGVDDDHRGSLERTNEANGVIRSVSMLLEIASAEAAEEDGLLLGDMDFAELQAEALMVFMAADIIPGIKGGWTKPVVKISPTGEVMTNQELVQSALQTSAERRHERDRARQSDAYEKHFGEEAPARTLPPDFKEVISNEYLADDDAVLDLPAATARMAGNRNEGVLVLTRSDLIRTLEAFEAMEGKRVAALIDRLTMPVRAGWDDLTGGFQPRDFDLSRFDRPQSLIARPILTVKTSPDPLLAVAPAVIERTLFHNLSGAMQGALQNEFWQSPTMRAYAGAAGARVGIEFNDEVAKRFSELGLRAWSSAKPAWALNCKTTPEVEGLGDIDVLAVSQDGSRVWVVEVKDLKLCRTLGEIARRLSEYRGVTDAKGRPDKMLRHLRRVRYVRENAGALVGRLKLTAPPAVSGMVVVRAPQPMEQIKADTNDARVVMFEDLEAVSWTAGLPG